MGEVADARNELEELLSALGAFDAFSALPEEDQQELVRFVEKAHDSTHREARMRMIARSLRTGPLQSVLGLLIAHL